MFENLTKAPGDKILALMGEYAADSRSTKIDLGVGVYKDEQGVTPVMRSVRKAEERILSNEKQRLTSASPATRGYGAAVLDLVLADSIDRSRVRIAQAPGGTGSLWVLMQLINRARPGATVYVSDPTWANHNPIAINSGLKVATYPYFDPETRGVKFEQMLAALDRLGAEDVVLLHGCCHNPTGANLTDAQWDQVAESLVRTGALPFIDLAYLGFGDGIEADAYGTRKILSSVPEAVVAFSGSKNFGLYRERVGAAILVARNAEQAETTNSQLLNIIRGAYSQPPDHGAEIIRTILEDASLRAEWEEELAVMRNRMISLRKKLADAIRERSNSTDFDFVADHRGMFSLLGLTNDAVEHLKATNGVYMTGDSRINVAGIPEDRVGDLADAFLGAVR
ncbi:amino acid aminotransferase [Devosia aurantiaca]|uniref:Aspartate/tyrosine/aromatic aminotransferase n=1 Tax=Devosia aurantiaca TaxID=2714858 RepID=A0A6M1SQ54_9HYPH|nr:amino acid aminotransferase [Devosia aurantiaca]NGP17335.1 aspartate/tyrosine/aromatic aminotransferase [Devosia aurantiaca]